MPDRDVIQLIVQKPGDVVRDITRMRWWYIFVWLIIIAYIAGSATLFQWLEAYAQEHAKDGPEHFSWFTSLYFTAINFTTVGFGDITPKTEYGRILAIVNSLAGLLIFGWLVALGALALQPSQPTPPSEADVLDALVGALIRRNALLPVEALEGRRPGLHIYIELEPPAPPRERG
ncbi:potassium channel family protein [Bradyrhizobium barranii]|uniref:Potassium channel family protein n=1 Tax=Bradyrhizobium barranii TaxID=2992140 RepID=A0ABY3QY86_9BRAD|nr:potassium channel family protein [Bradyrhizobium japonicum]UFW90566.1 potassium channel family protein [Bradyrhizobium japonicum]